jgi:hypothetical protein
LPLICAALVRTDVQRHGTRVYTSLDANSTGFLSESDFRNETLKSPGFAIAAVLVLALRIGANTAIFSLINVALLKPVSGREPERLVGLYSRDMTRADNYRSFSHPNYSDLRARREVFDDILATNLFSAGVTEGDTTRRIMAVKIGSNYFSVFGV